MDVILADLGGVLTLVAMFSYVVRSQKASTGYWTALPFHRYRDVLEPSEWTSHEHKLHHSNTLQESPCVPLCPPCRVKLWNKLNTGRWLGRDASYL